MPPTTLFRRPSLLRKKTRAHAEANGNPESRQMQQPMSDGSEEFFEEFTPEERGRRDDHHTRDILVGLGITAGVLIGLGATLWLRKKKGARGKWRKLFA